MAAAMSEDRVTPDRGLAQELIGDMAQLLNNTRPTMVLDGGILAALTLGISLEAGLARSPLWQGMAGIAAGALLACLIASWLTAVTKLLLAGRPILGIVSDHRWKAGAPLDPRAKWLTLPPIKATPEEWIWVRAHLLIGAARIRMDRVQRALTWTVITTALFLAWTVMAFLHP
ncbi:MAG TPA: hypothetical protein VFB06_30280 [Streptosporangiaceae bacterium]|nr:hypothetical protein [Streptosporangiaceae bacterium]